ncbi:DUF300-domain-containing protein [Balamuthia mandrillaris]
MELYVVAWIVAGVCALSAFFLSVYLILQHLFHYTQPVLQKYIVRILFMVPIYAVDSWLSLRFASYALYFDLVRDCYEAYVLYMFFNLLVAFINTYDEEAAQLQREQLLAEEEVEQSSRSSSFYGGYQRFGLDVEATSYLREERLFSRQSEADVNLESEERVIRVLEQKPLATHPWPLCCLPKFKPGRSFLRWSKRLILQFVLVKPATGLVAAILAPLHLYGEGEFVPDRAYLWVTIIDNIIIMFAFWQGVTIAALAFFGVLHDIGKWGWSTNEVTTSLQDFLITCEMFAVAIAHHYAFSYRPYINPDNPTFLKDIRASVRPIARNFGSVLHQGDIIDETVEVFHLDKVTTPMKMLGQGGRAFGEGILSKASYTSKHLISKRVRKGSKGDQSHARQEEMPFEAEGESKANEEYEKERAITPITITIQRHQKHESSLFSFFLLSSLRFVNTLLFLGLPCAVTLYRTAQVPDVTRAVHAVPRGCLIYALESSLASSYCDAADDPPSFFLFCPPAPPAAVLLLILHAGREHQPWLQVPTTPSAMTEGEEEAAAVMATEAAHTPRLALTVGAGASPPAQEDHQAQQQQQLPSASGKLQGKLQALKHKVQKRRVERRLSQYQQHLLEAQHWRSKCWSEVQRKTRTKKPRFEAVRNLDQFKRYDRWEQTQFREVNWKQFYEDMTGRRGKHLHDYFNSPWTLSSIFLLIFCQLYLFLLWSS